MSSASPKPRFLRLQFSLRALLVLITLVAVGLTVFRWPWTEEVLTPTWSPNERPTLSISTWRRSWTGKPEKHGSDLKMQFELHRGEEKMFANGELTSIRTFLEGEPQEFRRFHNGVFRPAELPTHEISGVWTSTKQHGDETVTQRCAWRNAQRHGMSTWTSSNGKVLQSAEFDRGRIVKWNGEPVAAAIERWVRERVENQDFRISLLAEIADEDAYSHWQLSRRGVLWTSNERFALVHYGFIKVQFAGPTDWLSRYQGRRLGEVILEMALNESGMLAHRYGTPCVVPICTNELNWRDPTNINAVKFEPESAAAMDWIELGYVDFMLTGWPAAQLKDLCEEKTIKVDTSAIDYLDPPPYTGPIPNTIPDYPRPFRDLLGHILYDAGYHCEQRGDTIVVLPKARPGE